MHGQDLEVSMHSICEKLQSGQGHQYVKQLIEKLRAEGICAPKDLLRTSEEELEKQLSTNNSFNFIEMVDTLALRTDVAKNTCNIPARERSRSPYTRSFQKQNDDEGNTKGTKEKGRQQNFRIENGNIDPSESCRHKREDSICNPQSLCEYQGKIRPDVSKRNLCEAIEADDIQAFEQLLLSGADIEERFQGWTPLMKASERDQIYLMQMLLERKANIEASNKKGRTAVSFAAAPSAKRKTAVGALRLLLENGADAKRRCIRGYTPKDYAVNEGRDDAIHIFQEFSI